MTNEEKNIEKRKSIPLTTSESLTFFFFPIGFFGSSLLKTKEFNESEIERFERFGFDLKLKQAKELTLFGIALYFGLIIIILFLINY